MPLYAHSEDDERTLYSHHSSIERPSSGWSRWEFLVRYCGLTKGLMANTKTEVTKAKSFFSNRLSLSSSDLGRSLSSPNFPEERGGGRSRKLLPPNPVPAFGTREDPSLPSL